MKRKAGLIFLAIGKSDIMNEDKNTPNGTPHHDKEHLPKPILNNAQDPDSIKDPLKEELDRSADMEKENKEKKNKASNGNSR